MELNVENIKDKIIKGVILDIEKTECRCCKVTDANDKGIYFLVKDKYLGFLPWWWVKENIENIHFVGNDNNVKITGDIVVPTNYELSDESR